MDAKNFPSAQIKVQPVFTLSGTSFRQNALPLNDISSFSRARYALAAAALYLKNTNQQNTVLLPAYHCPALVEPFIYAGYNLVFYPQSADLSSDITLFSNLLTPQVSHVVVVRYFGFSQNADALLQVASLAGKAVIEDNAHSLTQFWQTCVNKPIAVSASVSSIAKTLGSVDGGLLYLPGFKAVNQLPDIATELKAFISGSRSIKCSALAMDDLRYFRGHMQTADCLRVSRWLMLHSNYEAVNAKRRENYNYLANKLQHSCAGKLVYPSLGKDDVPYVVPFLLYDIKWFAKLREQAVQVLRWEELAETEIPSGESLRQLLIQLPCHQGLSTAGLDKIAEVLT